MFVSSYLKTCKLLISIRLLKLISDYCYWKILYLNDLNSFLTIQQQLCPVAYFTKEVNPVIS